MADLPTVFLVIETIWAVLPGSGYVPTAPLGPMTMQQCEQLRPTYDKWPGVASAMCKPAVGWRACQAGPVFGMACPIFDN